MASRWGACNATTGPNQANLCERLNMADSQIDDAAPARKVLSVISLGAGVQSTTMALMAAHGEITPMPDCAIFADTQAEPAAVYRHLDWLETKLPFPVHRVTVGSLRDEILGAMNGTNRMDARPPFFTLRGGMLNRQCTQDFKIIPIQRKVRELAGIKPRSRGPKEIVVEQWIGISTDEAARMKPSRFRWQLHRFPLVDMGLSRNDCLRWMERKGYPKPAKSACTFCPYHNNAMWREMKLEDPESFADAVAIDEAIRPGIPGPKRPKGEAWFLHSSRVPLAEVDFSTAEDRGQLNMFNNECEGMCGV